MKRMKVSISSTFLKFPYVFEVNRSHFFVTKRWFEGLQKETSVRRDALQKHWHFAKVRPSKPLLKRKKKWKKTGNVKHLPHRWRRIPPGVDFTNILCTAFKCTDPKTAKKDIQLDCIFCAFGTCTVKATCKILVKMAPGVNLTKILQATFVLVDLRWSFWHTVESVDYKSRS